MATKGKSATTLSCELLRSLGYSPWVVEKWVANPKLPGGGVRRDLYNGIDVVALHPQKKGSLGIQCTKSTGNAKARVDKILELPAMALWVAAGNALEVHGWRKLKRPDTKGVVRSIWVPVIYTIELIHFTPEVIEVSTSEVLS